jgi:hypothetical protein
MTETRMNFASKACLIPHHLPIIFHGHVEGSLDFFADACRWDKRGLREASERAIRGRHHEAWIGHESEVACVRRPNIWHLDLGPSPRVEVAFTVEERAVIVRGYSYEIDGEPLDDHDGGYYVCESFW